MTTFHYLDDAGHESGPYSESQIQTLAASGTIHRSTPCRADDGSYFTAVELLGSTVFDSRPAVAGRRSQKPRKPGSKNYTTEQRNRDARRLGGFLFAVGVVCFVFIDATMGLIGLGLGGLIWILGQKTTD